MEAFPQPSKANWVAQLRTFLGTDKPVAERCELCEADIAPAHSHLIEPASHRLLCACPPCALLFDSPDAVRYKRVPRRASRLADFDLSGAQWDAFLIPINLAFFFHSGNQNRVLAMYPGPAGPTESALDLDAWDDLAAANPVLAELEPDVEALLVNRVQDAREYYRVPIDRCYELVGQIRSNWHGLSGGAAVGEAIQTFFAALREETSH
ncbi:DUF5947 family protein [Spectribacter hydrogenooxidans]|uniref:DUF5947 family protein n=1 Tax=Spectribacter hydrogenoxidans TaxID=3075608 RepID=A0ABU3C403_9GAMM|nr:DUF5947 family protein [Salinisphaera sp. W335]MDT0636278.1 DUF5947 family protein [Salinisphaera sp. W335]